MRHFPPGQDFGQLFGPARGIFCRDNPDLNIALAAQRLFQGSYRFRFVIFNTHQNAFRLQYPGKDPAAFQHFGGVILHQPVISGDVRLALCSIND